MTKSKSCSEICDECKNFGVLRTFVYNDYTIHPVGNQYFDTDLIHLESKERFVDAGAFDLATSEEFRDNCRDKECDCFIYAYEPDSMSYEKCLKKIESKSIVDIKLINACLWDKEESLCFDQEGTGSSAVSKIGKDYVKAVTLDGLNKGDISFIKMDIEGAELNALVGAQKTIMKSHPKLAICLYHKPEDIYNIPLFIKKLDPSYRLYIRHYSNYITETILYAI